MMVPSSSSLPLPITACAELVPCRVSKGTQRNNSSIMEVYEQVEHFTFLENDKLQVIIKPELHRDRP